jgi:hypothetical protein
VRLLVSIGSDLGDPDDAPLRWAASDARRVAALFVQLGGVAPDRAYLLLDEPAQAVRERLLEVAGRVQELAAAGHRPVLIVYASAHAAAGVLHLRGTHLPLEELRARARAMPAQVRVVVVDACDGGAVARRKGGAPAPAWDVSLAALPLSGEVLITSSGPAEASQEWDSLGGGLFTHHLLTGLRGDADLEGDGQVTLSEAYAYAWRRTVASSAGAGQHPTFDIDLSGQGELILSEPRAARSAVVLPAEAEGRYVLSSQPRPDVVAEVEKKAGRPLRLAVPPGRYLLRKRLGTVTAVLDLELPYGGEVTVDDRQLSRRSFADVAFRGGFVELRPWALALAGAAESSPLDGGDARFTGALALRRAFGEAWAQATLRAGVTTLRGVGTTTGEQDLALGAAGGLRWLELPVIPYAGLAVELRLLRQSPARNHQALLGRVFGAEPLPVRYVLGLAAGPVAGLEVPLPARLFALAQLRLLGRWLRVEGGAALSLGADVWVGAGLRF